MKHKRLIVGTAAAATLAIAIFATGTAFGWWTTSATNGTGNLVSTGTAGLSMSTNTLNLSGLVPQTDPASNAPDSAYGAIDYAYVANTGNTPLMFYGYLADPADTGGLVPYIHIRIWLDPTSNPYGWTDSFNTGGPWPVYSGSLSTLWNSSAAGKVYLGSVTPSNVATPILPGQAGVYKIAVWLDSSAPNSTQGQTATFSITFAGEQLNQWQANGNSF